MKAVHFFEKAVLLPESVPYGLWIELLTTGSHGDYRINFDVGGTTWYKSPNFYLPRLEVFSSENEALRNSFKPMMENPETVGDLNVALLNLLLERGLTDKKVSGLIILHGRQFVAVEAEKNQPKS